MEEKFLMMFRINHPLDSSVEFMKVSKQDTDRLITKIFMLQVWYRFDTNCNGFIEEEELRVRLSPSPLF